MNEKNEFVLSCTGGDADADRPVLVGVQADCRLDGVLFELTLRQTYRNAGPRTLEVVYTFPLPYQAVLLGLASELNGERSVSAVVAKQTAERQYEASLAEGDAPVMLESLGNGLHTANIGNLKPGDELVLELRLAQLLAFEQERLRLSIPTTIAPRYGRAEATGLQPQQVPQVSLDAEYPLALSVTVAGTLAGAALDCPTHPFTRHPVEGGVRLDLAVGAWMDRDVVLLVQPHEGQPALVIQSQDVRSPTAPKVLLAAMPAPVPASRQRIALKLLVDCSGSMGGDSIASARATLRGVLGGLGDRDLVSLSRFGNDVVHSLPLYACNSATLDRASAIVGAIEADMGGTEMAGALHAVFALKPGVRIDSAATDADVLLITDGEIWEADSLISSARRSRQRVFAIGVGSAPAEGVLRELAEATGGACEFATPGEALEAAARRMLQRIRQQPWRGVRMDWGCSPAWQVALQGGVFGGDTVIALAGFGPGASVRPRLLAMDAQGQDIELARGGADAPCPGDSLPRIAAARRIAAAKASDSLAKVDTVAMAIDYQLMGPQTNCILVHQRAEADKASEEAELHRVSSMLAAGWGATATVAATPVRFSRRSQPQLSRSERGPGTFDMCYAMVQPSVLRSPRTLAAAKVDALANGPDPFSIPAFLRRESKSTKPATLKDMAQAVITHLEQGGQQSDLVEHCKGMALHPDAAAALGEARRLGSTEVQAWLLLTHWTLRREDIPANPSALELLRPHVEAIPAQTVELCVEAFERSLGSHPLDRWTTSRASRLARALARISP